MSAYPPIKDILKKYKIVADKKLGQNFLFDQNLTDKIVRSAGDLRGKTVIEVGPGAGILTRSILASNADHVVVFEKDKRCVVALRDYLLPLFEPRLRVVEADVLNIDLCEGVSDKPYIIANLPYNIATELLFNWLASVDRFCGFTLMFQKEVAMRIAAQPGTREYGRLAVKTQLLCDVKVQFDLAPSVFYPPPKVTSTVLKIIPRKTPLFGVCMVSLDRICKVVFGQRRKTLRVSLRQLVDDPIEMLDEANIDSGRRPEELNLQEFCALANVLSERD